MLSPVISSGLSIPKISNIVGAKSASFPDLTFNVSLLLTNINGKPTAKVMFFNGISRNKNGEINYLIYLMH